MFKWADSQRWCEASKEWESFVKIAEDLRKRSLRRNEDNKTRALSMNGGDMTQDKEEERRENKMKEKERQRKWDPAWGNQMRIPILGDWNLIVNWINGKWKINNQYSR